MSVERLEMFFDGRRAPALASPEVIDKSVRAAVQRGLLMARLGGRVFLREALPDQPIPHDLELLVPPPPVRGGDLGPKEVPEAWHDGKADLGALAQATSRRRGHAVPWVLLRDAVTEALAARPEFAALSEGIRAQELTLGSIKGGYWPRLNLSTGVTTGGAEFDNLARNWSGGVSLDWPLFEGRLTRAQVIEARAKLLSLKSQFETLRLQVRLEVEQARLAIRAAKAAIEAAADAVVNARKRLELAEGRYQTGVGNMIELGDAQVALNNAEAQKVQADYNLAAARARLLQALGRF